MKELVLSGINLFAGGTLEIYKTFLREIGMREYDKKYHVTAFVNRKEFFDGINCIADFIEIPDGRRYRKRIHYEEKLFYEWSKKKDIDVWIAMHDITPKVVAKKRFTYYHSPQIFYKMPLYKAKLDPRCYAITKFYKYFVGRHINETTAVIVQANWIREKLSIMYPGCNYIVARPEEIDKSEMNYKEKESNNECLTFFYPSFPRVFKNFEVVCEACKLLNKKQLRYQMLITVKGDESKYAEWLFNRYRDVRNIKWLGVLSRDEIEKLYSTTDILIFPSTLETWGLPITEWGKYKKPMILADLPYAHETAEHENNKVFFEPDNSQALADIMESAIKNREVTYEYAMSNNRVCDEWGELLAGLLD